MLHQGRTSSIIGVNGGGLAKIPDPLTINELVVNETIKDKDDNVKLDFGNIEENTNKLSFITNNFPKFDKCLSVHNSITSSILTIEDSADIKNLDCEILKVKKGLSANELIIKPEDSDLTLPESYQYFKFSDNEELAKDFSGNDRNSGSISGNILQAKHVIDSNGILKQYALKFDGSTARVDLDSYGTTYRNNLRHGTA